MAARRRNPDMVANALMRRVSNVPRFDAEARILHRIDEMDTRLNARIDMLGTHVTASLDDMKATFTVEYVCYKFCIYCY
jgi:hypothetical protein